MSGQVDDKFIFNKSEYSVSAIEFPENFLDIYSLGIKPIEFDTGCWRGYVATFAINKENLVLKKLYTNNGNDIKNEIIEINKKLPKINIPKGLCDEYKNTWKEYTYNNINLNILYTGSIIITKGFIWDRYVHMGFQSPISFEVVIQLTFNKGKLSNINDLSETAKKIREKEIEMPENYNNFEDMIKWINNCFDVSYSKKAGELLKK